MKKVSILMSIYNESEREIGLSINSILEQTYKDIELIIVIDNPKEKEKYLKLLEKYTLNYSNIIVSCNEENIGLAMSMNKAFELSNGDYIARMDADDISIKNRIEKEVNIIENHGYDFVFTGYSFIDEQDNLLYGTYKYYSPNEIYNSLLTTNCIHHPTVLMTREVFSRVGGYRDFPCSQDYDLWLRLLQANCKFFMIDESLLKYRIRSNSTTSRKRFLQACTLFYISNLFYERLQNGTDGYSKKNYDIFIKKCNTKYWFHKKYINYFQSVQKKLGKKKYIDFYLRLYLLSINKFIRDSYLLKIKIKKKGRLIL